MKSKGLLSLSIAVIMVLTMAFTNVTTAFATTGSKKISASPREMYIQLTKGTTGNSNVVSFNVLGLPANAKVTKLEIHSGSVTATGAMLTNYFTFTSTNKNNAEKIYTTNMKSSEFLGTKANGLYQLSFNCTCTGGAIVAGVPTNTAIKGYKDPYITVYWDDTL